MNKTEQTNKRLAKNTVFMYIRMALLTIISLYTSRVVLQQLGVSDFGIYGVVGSVVAMFSSLRALFSSSTQRFLNFEMGQGNYDKLKLVFNLSIIVNLLVAIVFVILVEIVGLWFLHGVINIPEERLIAAHYVFQFSVLSAVISIFTTSYDACIIAHEHMDFYAIMSVIEGLMKLTIVFILGISSCDKLILYSFLLSVVSVIVIACNILFCRRKFTECRYQLMWDKTYLRKMTSFAGWNFFGNTSFILSQNGINMVLNVFGGPIVNAARSIAYQVSNTVIQVINNIGIVIKPYAIKTYSSGDTKKAMEILYFSSKLYFFIQLVIVATFVFFTKEIISLWLGSVPQYSTAFLDLVLIQSLIRALHAPIDVLFYSSGRLKLYQLTEGIMLLLPVAASYILLYLGLPYYSAFMALIVTEFVNFIFINLIASRQCELKLKDYWLYALQPCVVSFLFFLSMYAGIIYWNFSISYKIVLLLLFFVTLIVYIYKYGLNDNERAQIIGLVRKRNG